MHPVYSAFSVFTSPCLGTVIGMASQNGGGPVNLFKEHDANHLMRPGRRAERNAQFSLALQFGRKSVRAADCENGGGDSFVPPAAKMLREACAIDALAALIQRYQHGIRVAASRARLSEIS